MVIQKFIKTDLKKQGPAQKVTNDFNDTQVGKMVIQNK
jgi:hypothetical protein